MNLCKVHHILQGGYWGSGWCIRHSNDYKFPIKQRQIASICYVTKESVFGIQDVGNGYNKRKWLLGVWERDVGHPRWFVKLYRD